MKLFGALSCILASALAIFAIVTGFTPNFRSVTFSSKLKNPQAIEYGDSANRRDVEVILINEDFNLGSIPACGFGMGCSSDAPREDAENEFRHHNFRKAAQLFEAIVKSHPSDIRSQLGLGKTYVVLHRFDDAIPHLSEVRNECHHVRYRPQGPRILNSQYYASSGPFEISTLDGLPQQACEALDHEARLALEAAVTGVIKPALPECDYAVEFKNDRHLQVLNASLQLAKKYHEKSQFEQLKAMYQLANENTRTLPPDLITACTLEDTSAERLWQNLARSSLNAAVDEEKEWYLQRLAAESVRLVETDIKKAAVYHTLLRNELEPIGFDKFNTAKAIKEQMNSHSPDLALFYANGAYDCGIRSFESGYELEQAKEFFLLARDVYIKYGTAKDLADTNYNLGIISYQRNKIAEAKHYFKLAARIYPGKKRFEQDELAAAFNFGVLAVDLPAPGDEKYLLNLFEETHHPEAATLLGLHYMRNNEYEKAYAPFKKASVSIFPSDPLDEPQLYPEKTILPKHHDRAFTDDQVIESMFARQKVIDKFVSCRFAIGPFSEDISELDSDNFDGTQRLTSNRQPSFASTVWYLFPTILRRTNRIKELEEYIKTKTQDYYDQNWLTAEQKYSDLLRRTLRETWFCPPHLTLETVPVRVRLTENGSLVTSQFELGSLTAEMGAVRSSVGESIRWTALPPPPPSFAGKEFILIYNASHALPPCLPAGTPVSSINEATNQW